jgi:hypothetical protein
MTSIREEIRRLELERQYAVVHTPMLEVAAKHLELERKDGGGTRAATLEVAAKRLDEIRARRMPLNVDLALLPHIAKAMEGAKDADADADAGADSIPPGTFCIPHGDRRSTRRLDELVRLYGGCRVLDLFERENDQLHVAYTEVAEPVIGAASVGYSVCQTGYAKPTRATRLAAAGRVPRACLVACAKGIMRPSDPATHGRVRTARIPVPVTVYTPAAARGDKRRRDGDEGSDDDIVFASKRLRREYNRDRVEK